MGQVVRFPTSYRWGQKKQGHLSVLSIGIASICLATYLNQRPTATPNKHTNTPTHQEEGYPQIEFLPAPVAQTRGLLTAWYIAAGFNRRHNESGSPDARRFHLFAIPEWR